MSQPAGAFKSGVMDDVIDTMQRPNPVQEAVKGGRNASFALAGTSKIGSLGLPHSRVLDVVSRYLLDSSRAGSVSTRPVTRVGVAAAESDIIDSDNNSSQQLEYQKFGSDFSQLEHDSSESQDGSVHTLPSSQIIQTEVSLQQDTETAPAPFHMVDEEPVVVESLPWRNFPRPIPVSEQVYLGVPLEDLDPEAYGLDDYGVFDGTTLKMSRRVRREARLGPSRRILSQEDLDIYCTGLQYFGFAFFFSNKLFGQV